jgi:hypothetical protein
MTSEGNRMKALSVISVVTVAAAIAFAGCASGESHQSKARPQGEGHTPRGVAIGYDSTSKAWGYAETDAVTRRYNSATGQWEYSPGAEPKGYTPISPRRDSELDRAAGRPLDEGLKGAP